MFARPSASALTLSRKTLGVGTLNITRQIYLSVPAKQSLRQTVCQGHGKGQFNLILVNYRNEIRLKPAT